ncbi:MAG: HEAT repeat domain-containing protein [Acidobacteriota bacterium]
MNEPNQPSPISEPGSLRLMFRLFLIPLAVVAACVGVYFLFGLITGERQTPRDYINEIRAGTETRRWQAAYELASLLSTRTPEELRRQNLAPDLIRVLEDTGEEDPRVRRYLVLALGRLQDTRGVPTLQGLLEESDGETVIFALWALGNIGDPSAVGSLTTSLRHSDPGIRKMAAHSLGRIGDPGTIPALRAIMEDPEVDVTWNAALALSRIGDRNAVDLLVKMIDRDYLDDFPAVEPGRQDEIIINAVRGLGLLRVTETRALLVSLSREDPSTRVRSAALDSLGEFPSADPSPP